MTKFFRAHCLCLIFAFQCHESAASLSEDLAVKRIRAHLLVQDVMSACEEAKTAFSLNPNSQSLFEAYIKALAKGNDEKTLWSVWGKHAGLFPSSTISRELLEAIAWGIIENGSKSSGPLIRIMAVLGAFFGQDAKGVDILCRHMRDANSQVRAVAVQLSGNMHDAQLSDEMVRLLAQEKNWAVRMEVIKAIGRMSIKSAQPALMAIIENEHAAAEEKGTAITSLVNMLETIHHKDLVRLLHSNRSGLRLLGCSMMVKLYLHDEIDLIVPLFSDHHAEVRCAAFKIIGILRPVAIAGQPAKDLLYQCVQDRNPYASITAAWALCLYDPPAGQQAIKTYLNNENHAVRLFAAAALSSTGKYGVPLVRQAFEEHSDLYVKMNLAFGLIAQRLCVNEACDLLYKGLMNSSERWMRSAKFGFEVLAPSKLKHDEATPQYPELMNLQTRLEVLNILAMLKHSKAQEAVRKFLQLKTWGITGAASSMLLTEGDENALELVQVLLQDPDPTVRIQAALILALWGRGEDAIEVLKNGYEGANRELKERILEGLGHIKSPSSIAFLVERLQEPYQSLRIMSAAALLQCLNY